MIREEKIQTTSGMRISVLVHELDGRTGITLTTDMARECVLHWGVSNYPHETWRMPPRCFWPEGSRAFDSSAVQTPFNGKNGRTITIEFEKPVNVRWLNFVLFFPGEGRWDNNHGRDYRIEIPPPPIEVAAAPLVSSADSIAREIIDKEMGRHGWTLMHRFDLCYELLDKIGRDDLEGLSMIYVWLRFSALRQLDWQRNYNTKPRELGHAMDRLTLKLAARYIESATEGREIIRLILTTLGRGSNAQRVRDEVLNIMHRHHIKEVSGHFTEEWHQKLHNNTTPDDVIICEAYLEFLRSNGDLGRFYQTLEAGGVTRERLRSYERPVTTGPDFIPHLKDALIRDFEHFLGILKEVHAGADLGVAMLNARHLLDTGMQSLVDFIWASQNSNDVVPLLEKALEARRRLSKEFFAGPAHKIRDLLFLDIALEDFVRMVVERSMGQLSPGQIVLAIGFSLENLSLTHAENEIHFSLRFWHRLLNDVRESDREWSLLAESGAERLLRAIGSFAQRYQDLLQPKAAYLGREFHASPWTVDLFTEEVLRGRPAFALSLLLHAIDPVLRKNAELGDWQIISRGKGVGEVIITDALRTIQGKDFPMPGVVISNSVSGDEEIPGWVSAIITPSIVDSLSHLAIRARNSGVVFATCFNPGMLEELKSYKGLMLAIETHGTNNVSFKGALEEEKISPVRTRPVHAALVRHGFTAYAIAMKDFTAHTVGYKSNNLKTVRDRLPSWIKMPHSVALPFGVFEKTLSDEANKQAASQYEGLLQRLETGTSKGVEQLHRVREVLLELAPPEELVSALKTLMGEAGLTLPAERGSVDWDGAWQMIKRVWASKWSERAYLSRVANGIRHEDLVMSVLVQEVVKADYSFVIHTANPFSGEREELFAEVVLGLGESLAANYPGRALDFVCRKGQREPKTLSFPSKSTGLFGGSLIFRSDSNGEDLEGYAGAGLYDSFVLPPPGVATLDYSETPLVWDKDFRTGLLNGITELGKAVEEAMGKKTPQDIEGAFSGGQYYIVQTRPQVGI